jgi:hypothetical protein
VFGLKEIHHSSRIECNQNVALERDFEASISVIVEEHIHSPHSTHGLSQVVNHFPAGITS